jgi:hypothetical protein
LRLGPPGDGAYTSAIRTRGRIPILFLLLLVLFGAAGQIIGGRSAVPSAAVATPTPTPTPTPTAGPARTVTRSLAAVQQAFNAGDIGLLCRSGALVDPAVIRQQNAGSGGCASQLETLMAFQPPLQLAVRKVALRRDLATATVSMPRHAAYRGQALASRPSGFRRRPR